MKHIVAVVLCLVVICWISIAPVNGALRVSSSQVNDGGGVGVRAQAVISDPTGVAPRADGATLTAIAIIRITGNILVRDSVDIDHGLSLVKHDLTAQQAYGQGLTNGYDSNPQESWKGLMWPYRDQYDYYPTQFDPNADDVGTPFDDQPGVYGFLGVDGIARGGPTDPIDDNPTRSAPSWLLRGVDGNGASGPASYFNFDIINNLGPDFADRTVRLRIIGASARVVLFAGGDPNDPGNYSEREVPMDDFEQTIQLPEPASISTLGILTIAGLVKRRRR